MLSVATTETMYTLGRLIGERLRGGEVIELAGDVGAGKTTLTKGIGAGLQVDDDVQSPSFTISRVYSGRNELELHHYDLYRLADAGVMAYELQESITQPHVVTVIEWAETVHDVLPADRVTITIGSRAEGEVRDVTIHAPERAGHINVTQKELA